VAEQRNRLIPLLRERDCSLPLRIEFRVRLDCTEQNNWESEIGHLRELLAQPDLNGNSDSGVANEFGCARSSGNPQEVQCWEM
jgi:hypothetical protein